MRGSPRVSRSARLHDVCRQPGRIVFSPPRGTAYSRDLWAPELHHLDGRFYLYVAADDGHNATTACTCSRATATTLSSRSVFKGRIGDATDRWAIDGTVLAMPDGRRYFVWSGWEGREDVVQSLYIAPMSNPWTICGERVRISTPDHAWERVGWPLVNEGPTVLHGRDGRVFVAYSASGSWTDDYCLGLLTLVGRDPLLPSSWLKMPRPVFASSGQVFGPGHACFVDRPTAARTGSSTTRRVAGAGAGIATCGCSASAGTPTALRASGSPSRQGWRWRCRPGRAEVHGVPRSRLLE